ncbi:phage tail protein [Diaphorobacter caeni]|uniref:phage tail protein n=1 Tax=Diaphorobacter caeni TaxID=2784387 RepID=UPI001890AFCF|nr:tail fiber protein [Diaphorobacter caeni]MBF5004227.1 phage tail protein [Diaphorobacter caeni]
MAEPFLSEIRILSFVFAPKGWAQCNGQFLPINQNQALFSLLGTTFGGNGQTTFALPDFRGRMPMHVGSGYELGARGGEEAHTLNINEIPTHTHLVNASEAPGNRSSGSGNIPAAAFGHYAPGPDTSLTPDSVTKVGGSQAHENRPPFLTLNFTIALQGIFPSSS